MLPVSVPEKTLEHWSSQYITYRYRSMAAQWWPVIGEDIRVSWLPSTPGKAVQLELKTTTLNGRRFQDVYVDLGQLWDYNSLAVGFQPFYVFPWPTWHGELAEAASADSRHPGELGFSRVGGGWWFAEWMVLLTTAEVAAVLQPELARHASSARGVTRGRLVRYDISHSRTRPPATWGSAGVTAEPIDWLSFWGRLENCGEAGWPQLMRLPAALARPGVPYSARELAERLRQAASEWDTAGAVAQMVTLMPDGAGSFRVTDAPRGILPVAGDHDAVVTPREPGPSDNRLAVFLDARTLFP